MGKEKQLATAKTATHSEDGQSVGFGHAEQTAEIRQAAKNNTAPAEEGMASLSDSALREVEIIGLKALVTEIIKNQKKPGLLESSRRLLLSPIAGLVGLFVAIFPLDLAPAVRAAIVQSILHDDTIGVKMLEHRQAIYPLNEIVGTIDDNAAKVDPECERSIARQAEAKKVRSSRQIHS